MADIRDIFSVRLLSVRHRRALAKHSAVAQPLFDAMLQEDPQGLKLAESPLAELPAADRLAQASSNEVISVAVASAGHLRRIPIEDSLRTVALRPIRTYRIHFAAIRVLEVCIEARLPFGLEDTKLLCSIALNAPRRDDSRDVTIHHGPDWPDFAARMFTTRLLFPERLDLLDVALGAAEQLDGGLYDGELASMIVRTGQRLARVKRATYEVGEMAARAARLLEKPTTLIHVDRR